jgi:hypothetical protein
MRTTDRHLGIVAVLIAVALPGCSGSSGGGSQTALPQSNGQQVVMKSTTPVGSPAAKKATSPVTAKSHAGKPASAAHRRASHGRSTHKTTTRSSKRAAGTQGGTRKHKKHVKLTDLLERDAKARRSLVAKMAPAVLKALGFPTATATTDHSGRIITVLIPRNVACTAHPSDEGAIRKRFTAAFKFARQVPVMVAGSGKALGTYVSGSCAPVKLPSAHGGVVLSQRGNGQMMTREFTVKAKTWTVVYENESGYFSAILFEGDQAQPQFVYSKKRETGKATFKGAGTYKLSVSASGGWRIEVHD